MYAKYVLFYLERPSSHEPVLNREVNSYSIEMLGYTLNVQSINFFFSTPTYIFQPRATLVYSFNI